MDLLLNSEIWIAFLTLLALEIVLGIDNVVFISILVDKLPEERQARKLAPHELSLSRVLIISAVSLLGHASLHWSYSLSTV